MAYVFTASPRGVRASKAHPLLASLAAALASHTERQARLAEIDALAALGDDELRRRGLTRSGLASHVLSDRFCY
ncbi:hypothetical protein DFO80_10574 [Rhodobacter sp. 140A]|uniref:DUF1127 domain-containing protein n=1 Tax=Paenirhodobacter ferrireducens TaxID=1215032 RepID=A0A443LV89_9RHOB|nr:hypothetical protein [Sinirhodobacter ferrireducens]RBP93650.1 hypothetical protein DFO80_10574 [Rhodobacter sp. 140A]RWR53094.1 hypothetical protein EOW65_01110 [Sinirhodobacter ferrireducens]